MDIGLSMETITQLENLARNLNIELESLINHIMEPEANPLPTEVAKG